MYSRRLLCLAFSLLMLAVVPALAAQDDAISSFPVFGEGIISALSPDGTMLAVYESGVLHNGEVIEAYLPVRVYAVETGELVAELTGNTDYLASVAFSPDSATIAGYQPTGVLYLWSLPSGDLEKKLLAIPGGSRLGYMLGGKELIVQQSLPGYLQIWDIETGAMVHFLANRYRTMLEMTDAFSSTPDMLVTFVPTLDGEKIISATAFGNIVRWDIASGEREALVVSENTMPVYAIRAVTLTPDEGALVYTYAFRDDEFVNVLNLSTLELTSLPAPDINVAAFALSPDGTRAAWISAVEKAELVITALDGSAPEQRIPLDMNPELNFRLPITSLAFLPDGNRVILTAAQSGSPENAAYIIQLDS